MLGVPKKRLLPSCLVPLYLTYSVFFSWNFLPSRAVVIPLNALFESLETKHGGSVSGYNPALIKWNLEFIFHKIGRLGTN